MYAVVTVIESVGDKVTKFRRLNANEIFKIDSSCVLGIDGSTTTSGLAIVKDGGVPMYTVALHRSPNETSIGYKVEFKRYIEKLLKYFPNIRSVHYEEPYINYVDSSKVLMSLGTSVQELMYENAPSLDYITYIDCSNTKWKKLFLTCKLPDKTPEQKKAIYERVKELYPELIELGITQDECDALGLALVGSKKREERLEETLKSKKKCAKFDYNIAFIGANTEDEAIMDLPDIFRDHKIPNSLIEDFKEDPNISELSGRGDFDKLVYEYMNGEDKLLMLQFKSDKYSNILLRNRVSFVSDGVDYVYAIVWRKRRKK